MEHKAWEEIRKNNPGAAWIDSHGNFCDGYIHASSNTRTNESIPGWQMPGFNGCWSCIHCLECGFGIADGGTYEE